MLNQVTKYHKRPAWLSACFLLSAFVCMLAPFVSSAQDKIYKTDKTVIEAKVTEINTVEIKYKKFSNLNGPAYIIPIKEVSAIEYENGEKETYNQAQPNSKQTASTGNASTSVNVSQQKARNFILSENINEAIAAYTKLIAIDAGNATLLAEDAYALALAGVYDAALMRLDLSWSYGSNTTELNFYTSQVFALMGYDDLASEFWKPSEKNKAPSWISSKAVFLQQKFRIKQPHSSTLNREQLIANFKHANELASQYSYFQSIALYHDITSIYPNEYLPYIGYSISLEKTGALAKSAQTIEKAISVLGSTSEDKTKKQFLEQRLASIKQNMTSLPPAVLPVLSQKKESDKARPQMMAYAGGMMAPSLTSINGRIGYFISGSSNASFDFGVMKNAEYSSSNVGFSLYNRQNMFVSGAGLMMSAANGNTSFAMKLSVGISKMNKAHTASVDIFVDVNRTLQKQSFTTACMSLGTSFYFGKR